MTSQNLAIFKGHFYAFFGSFFKVKVQNGGGYFGGLLKFQIFLGVLEISFILLLLFFFFFFLEGVNGRCWARAYV